MALITAFIIALVILIRRGAYISARDEYRRHSKEKIDNDWEKFKRFRNLYEDQYFETQVRRIVELKNDKYKQIVQLIKRGIDINPSDEMVVMALMAQQGKIPHKYIDYGICAPYRNPTVLSKSEFSERVRDQLVFLKWYNKKLRANGMNDDEMIFLIEGEFTTKDGSVNKTLWEGYRTEYKVSDSDRLYGKMCCWHGNANIASRYSGHTIYP